MTGNSFDHQRDDQLGAMLRDHLEAADHAGFVRQVLVGIQSTDSSWDVLSRWARPGIAAAIAFLTGVSLWFALNTSATPDATLADALQPENAPTDLLSSAQPDNDLVLQVVLER